MAGRLIYPLTRSAIEQQVNPAYKRRYMVMQHGVLKYFKHEPTSAEFFSEDDEIQPTVSPCLIVSCHFFLRQRMLQHQLRVFNLACRVG